MQKIRIKYSKEEDIKYISHLDIIRAVERSLRRSSIPIAFTQGFNPRQQIAFGTPTSVGMTSESEFLDLVIERWTNPDIIGKELSSALPPGIKLLEIKAFAPQGESLTSMINTAEYLVEISGDIAELKSLKSRVKDFFQKEKLIITRKREKGDKEIDIRPLVYRIELVDAKGSTAMLKLYLSVGNRGTVKPEEMIKALGAFEILKIHRTGLWIYRDKEYLSPI